MPRLGFIAVAAILALFVVPAVAAAQAPACRPGTPAAVKLPGLRGHVPYGPPVVSSVDESFLADWMLIGDIHIRMSDQNEGAVFFEDDVEPGTELYVELDLGDAPAVVTASFEQESLPQADGSTIVCSQVISRTVAGFPRILLPRDCGAGSYRPRSVIVACGDGNFRLRKLRWRRWNKSVATAHGMAVVNDCVPFCFNGTLRAYRVRLRAYRIRRCRPDNDRYRYTRLRITFSGRRPAGSPNTNVVRVVCARAP